MAENPYYLRGGTGISVPPGALGLVAGLFSNKSAEYPGGFLDAATLKSIFSITGESGSLVYTPGHERIPNNFYKRNPLDEYSAANFGTDLGQIYRQNPAALSFGGNTGTVNSFTPIDVGNLSVSADFHVLPLAESFADDSVQGWPIQRAKSRGGQQSRVLLLSKYGNEWARPH